MSLFDYLKKAKKIQPDKCALVIDSTNFNYSELYNLVSKAIVILNKNKITKTSTVLIVEDNSLAHILTLFALSYINATAVPANTQYSYDSLSNLINSTKVNSFIGNSKLCNLFNKKYKFKSIISTSKTNKFPYFFERINNNINIPNKKIDLNKNFLITTSSGSTSKPKPIVFTQNTKIARYKLMSKLYEIDSSDKIIITCPIDHSLGMRILFLSFLSGGTCVLMNKFTVSKYISLIRNYNVTFSVLVANQIYELINDKKNFKNFYLKKGLVSASAKLFPDAKKKLLKRKVTLYEMYGAAEIGTVTSISVKNNNNNNLKSVGKSYHKKIKIKILDKNNKFLNKYKVGEIVAKTPGEFKFYFNSKKLNKNSYFKGFFKTGDLGYLDEKNYLYFLSRKNNVIRRSGISIYPEDIEKILLNDKNIKEVAVTSKENKIKTIIYLFVKREKQIDQNYIKNICLKKLSTFQIPNHIILVNQFPKSVLGKINKRLLLKNLP
jgi:acyl-CoA synthetase (AMP-forming)/AMP-acid ligase II